MKFRTDDSLSDRLSRITSGRDSSNWLTEDIAPHPRVQQQLDNPDKEPTGQAPTIGSGGLKPDQKRIDEALGPLASTFQHGVRGARQGVDFKNFDPNSDKDKDKIRNFAGHAMLYARGLTEDGDMRQTSGAGARAFTHNAVQSLRENEGRNLALYGDGSPEQVQQLVSSTRPFSFSSDFIESSWNLVKRAFKSSGPLPGNYRTAKKDGRGLHAGMADTGISGTALSGLMTTDDEGLPRFKSDTEMSAANKRTYERLVSALGDEGLGKVINSFGSTSSNRARLMWKLYLEQGGLEGLTGLPLELNNIQLEHVKSFQGEGDPANEQEWEDMYGRAMERDSDQNFMLINQALNNQKEALNMEDFYAQKVRPLYELTAEDFSFAEDATDQVNREGEGFIENTLPLFIDKETKQFRDDIDLTEYFTQLSGFSDTVEGLRSNLIERFPAAKRPAATQFKKLTGAVKRDLGIGDIMKKDASTDDIVEFFENFDPEEALQNIAEHKREGVGADLKNLIHRYKNFVELSSPDAAARSEWAKDRSGAIHATSAKDRIFKRTLESLGLSHTWNRKGTAESPGDRGGISFGGSGKQQEYVEKFLTQMMEGGNDNIDGFKKLWRLAYKNAAESRFAGGDQFMETLDDLGFDPNNLPENIEELLKKINHPTRGSVEEGVFRLNVNTMLKNEYAI